MKVEFYSGTVYMDKNFCIFMKLHALLNAQRPKSINKINDDS